MLRSTAGLAVGAAGVSAATGSASATAIGGLIEGLKCVSDTSWETAPEDYPVIDLRSDSPAQTGDWPDDPDELTIFIHGLGGDLDGAWRDQAYTFETAANQNGWEPAQVAARYTTIDTGSLQWDTAVDLAKTAARRLVSWLREYDSQSSTSSYNVVAHSLGGHVTGTLLDELDGDIVIDDVALMAPAIPTDSVCDDGEYADGIRASAGEVHNYRSRFDDVVCDLYSSDLLGSGTDGLGCKSPDCGGGGWGWGNDGSTPSNFHDHSVTLTVTKHCNYPRPGKGCVPQIVDDIADVDDSDDGGDDGGWGWGW